MWGVPCLPVRQTSDQIKTKNIRMKKIYYLSTCDTCKKIMKETGIAEDKTFTRQDIKHEKITKKQLEEMQKMAGSYEALFSRRAIKYKELGLKDKTLSENDICRYILEDYTFLKRPVVIINDQIFIGSEKKNVEALATAIRP